jgi:hypothetical protein
MKLEISEHDGDVLETALATHLSSLRREAVHTDDREYRAGLRATIRELETIFVRLQRLKATDASPLPG